MKSFFIFIGTTLSYLYNFRLYSALCSIRKYVYTGLFKRHFKSFGKGSEIKPSFLMLIGPQYISVGQNCYIGSRVQLTAWDSSYIGGRLKPEIIIGDGSAIGDESHVTAINKIVIGKGVLTGKKVLITDNTHGEIIREQMDIAPLKREVVSKGGVIIEDNVWIGEKATIVANVRIGRGAIVAANSVVTKDVPPYSVVAGCPAKVVKQLS